MMMIPHMWYTCCIADAGKTWDLAALPSYNGKVNGRVDGDTYRILKGAKNPDAAFTVLSYLIGPASQKLLLTYGGMPARTADQDAFFAAKGCSSRSSRTGMSSRPACTTRTTRVATASCRITPRRRLAWIPSGARSRTTAS